MTFDKKVIVALDSSNFTEIVNLIDTIKEYIFGVKIGYEFFFNFGLIGYKKIQDKNVNIFLDLKLHDIPNTIKHGINAITDLNPYFTSVHIAGGDEMLKIAFLNKKKIKILGVTALTSLDDHQVQKYYSRPTVKELVNDYVSHAINNKIDGIVCSPHEIKIVKKLSRNNLLIVTPGVRPLSYKKIDDQKRTMSPGKAISLGADYLIIGRPITQSPNPIKEIIDINSEIEKSEN
tara:strand:+ start:60 stop:758 length:699 start_codon:yes stop_codon:yes gene_type:complete